jgi:DNA replication protein
MFEGFPDGKVIFSRIPDPFFSELLPQIDHLGELKVTLYALWRLEKMDNEFRYLKSSNFLDDELFMRGLGNTTDDAVEALMDAISRAVARGTFLPATVAQGDENEILYFLNTSKGRAAVEAIEIGNWRYTDDASIAVELTSQRPNIYQIYEKHIGPITPLLAEALQEAETTYPEEWISEAFRIAVEKNIRNWRYVEAILRRWQERGYDVRENRRDAEENGPEDFRRYSRGELGKHIKGDD